MVEGNPGPAVRRSPTCPLLPARAIRELISWAHGGILLKFLCAHEESVGSGANVVQVSVGARQICELRHNFALANRELTEARQ